MELARPEWRAPGVVLTAVEMEVGASSHKRLQCRGKLLAEVPEGTPPTMVLGPV